VTTDIQALLTWIATAVTLVIAYLNYRNLHIKAKPEIDNTNADTIAKQGAQIAELREQNANLWKRVAELQEDFDNLKIELSTTKRAYNRAKEFIRRNFRDIEIPDFTQTQDLPPLAGQQPKD